MTVIATGFDKQPGEPLPKMAAAEPAGEGTAAVPGPMPLNEEDVDKSEDTEPDPFDDIFKIFNKRD